MAPKNPFQTLPKRLHATRFTQSWLDLSSYFATLLFSAGVGLKMTNVFDCHFNDFCFLDSTSTFFEVWGWYEPAQVSKTIVHSISAPLFDDSVRQWVLKLFKILKKDIGNSPFINLVYKKEGLLFYCQ